MKDLVCSEKYYEFSVDTERNRLYQVMRGDWKDVSAAKDYLKHNNESVDRLQPGFTMLLDMSKAVMPSDNVMQKLMEIFLQAHMYSEEAGLRKQAQVVKRDTKDVSKTARNVMKETDYDAKMIQFTDPVEAEKWLDM
ncbi:MAG: hypothetical protein JW885_11830 [Deltaproteobacteria bacterium]|nr:hypothetical protein [Candidatus Zymogenaceae bacterium]